MNGFIPLSVPHIAGNELRYLTECIETGWVSSEGGFVTRFEEATAKYTGAARAVAANSGTSAIHVALVTLGIGAGDEVIAPTLTFISPINAIRYTGAEPVFMDSDDYLNMDPEKTAEFCEKECELRDGKLVNRLSGRVVRAILPVHIFGHPVNIEPLMDIAGRYNLFVIEDACEAMGSRYISGRFSGRHAGTAGHIGCLSFNGNKIITSGGGGMMITDNPEWARHAKYLTTQAKNDGLYYVHDEVGFNYRLTNIEAAVGLAQLEQLDGHIEIKRRNFERYKALMPNARFIDEPPYGRSNYWFYSLLTDNNRDRLISSLNGQGIQSRPIWKPNHLQRPYLNNQSYMIEKASYYYERVVNIPCSVGLTEEEIIAVSRAIARTDL